MKTKSPTRKQRILRNSRLFLPLASVAVLLVLSFKLSRHDLSDRELRLLTVGAVVALACYGASLWREARTL